MRVCAAVLTGLLWAHGGALHAQSLNIYCEDNKPIQFENAQGKATGFAVDVVREIQRRTNNDDAIQLVPWARGLNRLDTVPNTLLFSMARTTERERLYQWIGPIFENSYGFYVKADSTLNIHSLEEAKRVSAIGVYRGDVRDQALTSMGFTNLDRANANISNIKKLMAGRIAMFAGSPTTLPALAEEAGYRAADFKLLFVFMHKQLYIAASKGTAPSMVTLWSATLEQMKRDKSFERIFRKYFADLELPVPATP